MHDKHIEHKKHCDVSIFHWKVHVRSPSCGGPTANHARPHLWQMQLDPIIYI